MKQPGKLWITFVLCCFFLATGCSGKLTRPDAEGSGGEIRNIIFLIGDGMGLSQINSTRIATVGAGGELNIDKMPVVGLLKTHPADRLITDSAAAGTALACGVKTYNGAISMTFTGEPSESILEAAQQKGLATGLVVTSTITHATPAVFAAHVDSRQKQAEIAAQMLNTKVNILLGGGKGYFLPQSTEGSKRKDDVDLLSQAREAGYQIVSTKEELVDAKSLRVLGLFQLGALATAPPEPSIVEMTQAAIDLLRPNKGFFLMVEGSQIDWRSHDNDAAGAIEQMSLFDQAIKAAIDFARVDGRTLVVVTADHETGGMTINGGGLDGTDLDIQWTTLGHTGVDIPIFAYGPGASQFGGVYENTEVPKKFAQLLGIKQFPRMLVSSQKNLDFK